jgi:hypothetical protein
VVPATTLLHATGQILVFFNWCSSRSGDVVNKVTQPKSDTCFVFGLGGKRLICVWDNLISKWNGSEVKMDSEFLEAI